MKKEAFVERLNQGILVLDGATGTELAKQGLPAGVCPEAWVLEHPEAIHAVQGSYEAAGSGIVYTPTFGGNRLKLFEFGLGDRVAEINARLARIAREGVSSALVFGDMAPTGKFVEPFGELPFEEAVAVFREQAEALLAGGVDGFAIETMMDLQEARAALLAVRELCDLPVIVTMTFGEGGRTLTGNSPASAAIALEALGATAVGCNCSAGPRQMAGFVSEMKRCVRIPIVAKPNAGMPRFDNGRTVFDMEPEAFGELAGKLVDAGASIVGGCCGTTPRHIAALSAVVKDKSLPESTSADCSYVSSATGILALGQGLPFAVIGERLNPTGKKALQAELRSGSLELVRRFAREQAEAGAAMLDVNCGLPGVDEKQLLKDCIALLARESSLPLCIDTTNPEAAEAALRLYPGRALFNSISAEEKRLEKLLPVVAKYGAAIVALPLDDSGIPADVPACIANVERIASQAFALGYRKADMVVDGLVMTVSANPEAAVRTLDTIEWVSRVWKGCSVCGLSNVSFGLPRRDLVNRAFLGAAISRGLTMAIANPMNADIMDMAAATDVLLGRDANAAAYIGKYAATSQESPKSVAAEAALKPEAAAHKALLEGDATALCKAIDGLLADGMPAGKIVDGVLIPAITEVGEKYERQEFFLPQLMGGARAMKNAMDKLEPMLKTQGGAQVSAGRVVVATVKGDIHDIGKNIVVMMLKNYNFEVIDLGKDVSAETIVDTAQAENISLVGLSALMTTTMGQMKNVVDLARARGLARMQFIIGGAAVDQHYADAIGAHYAEDAMATVRLCQTLSGQ